MKELAEFLKSERLKQGLSLSAVSERVHVSVSMLQALEEEHYEQIGTPLLIRSFIKAYCFALGVDPMPMLERHEREITSFDQQDDGIRRYGVWAKALHRKGQRRVFLVLFLVMAVVVALYGGDWFSRAKARLSESSTVMRGVYSQQELPRDLREGATGAAEGEGTKEALTPSDSSSRLTAEVLENKQEKPDAPAVLGKTSDSSLPKKVGEGANPAEVLLEDKSQTAPPEVQKHRLEVEATQKTWIRTQIDDKKVENSMLRAGDKREWEAHNTIQIVVGNGGGVTMKWDGQPLGALGKPGRILRLRLPRAEPVRKPAAQ